MNDQPENLGFPRIAGRTRQEKGRKVQKKKEIFRIGYASRRPFCTVPERNGRFLAGDTEDGRRQETVWLVDSVEKNGSGDLGRKDTYLSPFSSLLIPSAKEAKEVARIRVDGYTEYVIVSLGHSQRDNRISELLRGSGSGYCVSRLSNSRVPLAPGKKHSPSVNETEPFRPCARNSIR